MRMVFSAALMLAAAAFAQDVVRLDFAKELGAVKPLHGVNNAPVRPDGRKKTSPGREDGRGVSGFSLPRLPPLPVTILR